MKVLTYTSFKEHCDLYTEIHGSIAVNSFRPNFHKKADKCTGAENTKFIGFNLSAVAYSINDFNAKIKVEILQQRQDWEPPQIEDLRKAGDTKRLTILFLSRLLYRANILKRLR